MRSLLLLCMLVAGLAAPAFADPSPAPSQGPTPAPSASPRPSATIAPTPSPAPAHASTPAPAVTAPPRFLGLPKGNRWIAATLSLAVNGLGQYYNGDWEKGNLMLASLATYPLAYGFDALTNTASMRTFSYATILVVKVWSAWDAFQSAGAAPPAPQPASPAPAK